MLFGEGSAGSVVPARTRPKQPPVTRTLAIAISALLVFSPLALAAGEQQFSDLGVAQPLPAPKPEEQQGILGNGGWLFADSPFVASQWQPVVISSFSYSQHTSLARPFEANLGPPGAAIQLGGELGLGAGFSLQATGLVAAETTENGGQAAGMAGLRFSAFPRSWEHWQLVLNAGWISDLTLANGVYFTLQSGFTTGILRAQLSVHAEHFFAEGRDGVDVMVTAGVGFHIIDCLSLGVEFLGQDLESIFIADGDDAEGGARYLIGPTVALAFFENKFSIVVGPALTLGSTGNYLIGRLAASYSF